MAEVQASPPFDPARSDAIVPVYPLEAVIGGGGAALAKGVRAVVRAGIGAALRQVVPEGKPTPNGPLAVTEASKAETTAASAASVRDKLLRYTLNLEHKGGGPKARWFQQALGFTGQNIDELAQQLVFDERLAVFRRTTEYGMEFSQTINVVGTNGRTIPVITGWMKGEDGVARFVTAYPGKP